MITLKKRKTGSINHVKWPTVREIENVPRLACLASMLTPVRSRVVPYNVRHGEQSFATNNIQVHTKTDTLEI